MIGETPGVEIDAGSKKHVFILIRIRDTQLFQRAVDAERLGHVKGSQSHHVFSRVFYSYPFCRCGLKTRQDSFALPAATAQHRCGKEFFFSSK